MSTMYPYCLSCRDGVGGIVGAGLDMRHRVTILSADGLGVDPDDNGTESTCGPIVMRRGEWVRPEDRLDEIERLRGLLEAPMTAPTPRTLLALRASLDMTQGEVAEALGVDLDTYGRWERGHIEPKRMVVLAMERLVALTEAGTPR